MNLLVDYDDSDSESEGTVSDVSSQSRITQFVSSGKDEISALKEPPCKIIGDSYLSDTHEGFSPKVNQSSRTGKHLYPFPVRSETHLRQRTPQGSCKGFDHPLPYVPTSGGVFGSSLTPKRVIQHDDLPPGVIKPYIPKRFRQQTQTDTCAEQPEQEPLSRGADASETVTGSSSQITSYVSEYIKTHLATPCTSTEIPTHLVFQLSQHTGPVNKVQWCPVQQQSHLLLSASMDKTIKVWDAVDKGSCLKTFTCHNGAVRDAQWSLCGRNILSGGFDSSLYLTDIDTGANLFSGKTEFKISTLQFHPVDQNLFVCGGFSPSVNAWDIRNNKVVRTYTSAVQQTLDILFLPEGNVFLSTTDAVSRDSADRTVIAWDFQTAAKISNQIFHERYTCPCLALHPTERAFAAQTNGNYMALFSTQRPFKINKKKRYEGHKVEGFSVGCTFSPDGTILATGSSEGKIYFYNYRTARVIHTLPGHNEACVDLSFHPVIPSLLATCDWAGTVKIWQ